jgi:hypothetical protein
MSSKKKANQDVIRISIRCPEDSTHAKIVRLDSSLGMPIAIILAELLCGTSQYYIFVPGEGSPIGRCLVCGSGPLTYKIEEFESAQ